MTHGFSGSSSLGPPIGDHIQFFYLISVDFTCSDLVAAFTDQRGQGFRTLSSDFPTLSFLPTPVVVNTERPIASPNPAPLPHLVCDRSGSCESTG